MNLNENQGIWKFEIPNLIALHHDSSYVMNTVDIYLLENSKYFSTNPNNSGSKLYFAY